MPNKSKSSSKSSSAEAVEGCEDAEFASVSIRKLLQLQERMFKNFVESIAASLTKRVDDLVGKVSDLNVGLEFSQKDIENHKTQINLLDTNLQSAVEEITKLQTLGAKQLEKATYLENQSRRNDVRVIEGIVEEPGESWESKEGKVKEIFTEKLKMESTPAIERAHRTGKDEKPDGTPKPRTVVYVNFTIGRKEKRSCIKYLTCMADGNKKGWIFLSLCCRLRLQNKDNYVINGLLHRKTY